MSAHSPGPVRNEELLGRFVMDPQHLEDDTGRIKETFFSDAFNGGASTHRLSHLTSDALHALGRAKAASDQQGGNGRPPRPYVSYFGYQVLKVSWLRSVQARSRVYDTARQDMHAHADIVVDARHCQGASKSAKQERKALRIRLLQHAFESGPVCRAE